MSNYIYVTKSTIPPLEEYIEEIRSIFSSHRLTNMGEKYMELTLKLKQFLSVNQLVLVGNGHMALELCLQALQLKGEVITSPFTFSSTTHAIVRNGLKPVFCDIQEDNYTIDADKIEECVTENTSAIVPIHVYGNVCNVEKIEAIARKHQLKVIYDAAHSFGVTYKGKGIGQYGDAVAYSFHATKVFNTIEGGAVATLSKDLADIIRNLSNFGIIDEENIIEAGTNAKMNELEAAMGLCNLRRFDEIIQIRKRLWYQYLDELEGVEGIILPSLAKDVSYNYAYFPIRVRAEMYGANRDILAKRMRDNGIFPRRYFYPLTSDYKCYQNKHYRGKTPLAKCVSDEILTLPLYPGLDEQDVSWICHIIKKI